MDFKSGGFMESKVKILGHPLHPMLIAFPVAFYVATFAAYVVYQNNADPFWFRLGVVANIAGVTMAVVAAIPGLIDWATAIPHESNAKQTGLIHMVLNTLSLLLFAAAAVINYNKWYESLPNLGSTLLLSGLGVVVTTAAGFYGWTLVQRYHVGIDLNAKQTSMDSNRKQKVFSTEPTSSRF
jgi:uncharacterized membrane protein